MWCSPAYTQFKAQFPEDVNIAQQEIQAENIFEKHFVVDKLGSLVNTAVYGGNNRVLKEWLSAVLRRGTSMDRVLALGFMIQEKPLSSLRHIESLIGLISPVKKQLCIKAIEVLTDLFETTLLPNRRTLIPFSSRPFSRLSEYPSALTEELALKDFKNGMDLPSNCAEYILAIWYFEDVLKKYYRQFLTSLESVLLSNTILVEKSKALNAIVNLISKKPENRDVALGIVINKLGDRSKGFVSRVIYKLGLLCHNYPHLKVIVVEQLRAFLFRPNLLERAKYYAIVFLSCFPLSRKDQGKLILAPDKGTNGTSDASLAAVLFRIYLSFFCSSIQAEELPERLIAALLTGICQVSPSLPSEVISDNIKDIDAVFKLVHVTSNFTISLQALNFLFQLTLHQHQLRDRFYQALYRKLMDSAIRWSARLPSLLKLVYQSIQADTDAERKAAFVQRLLSISLSHPNPGFVAGTLILLEKVRVNNNVDLVGTLNQGKASNDSRTLLPKSIGMVKPSHHKNDANIDSDEEHFSDAPSSDNEGEGSDNAKGMEPSKSQEDIFVWEHKNIVRGKKKFGKITAVAPVIGYDNTARDPRFAHALGQPCWQLQLLACCAHPTAAHFTKNLLERRTFKYSGDPFEDLSVAHFMERFVYKKPKSTTTVLSPGKVFGNASLKKQVHAKTLAPDSLAYKNLKSEQVPSEERFIHRYFNFIVDHPAKQRSEKDEDGSDLDEDFDQYLRKHEKGLIPDDTDDEDVDSDEFNYSTDEEDESKQNGSDDDNGVEEGGEMDGSFSLESENGGNDSYDDDEDDFSPLNNHNKSGKFDINKIFVSAEEVGNLYDSQELDDYNKRSENRKKKHNRPGMRRQNYPPSKAFPKKRKLSQSKKGSSSSKSKKSRRR
ncbi:hypothetical protein Aperf_G00000072509 [Anoplocephala perfoliata]